MLTDMVTTGCINEKPQSGGNMHVITGRSGFIDPSTDSQDGPNNTESYICKGKQLGLFSCSFHTFLTLLVWGVFK